MINSGGSRVAFRLRAARSNVSQSIPAAREPSCWIGWATVVRLASRPLFECHTRVASRDSLLRGFGLTGHVGPRRRGELKGRGRLLGSVKVLATR
jgi:hypothetical protein